MEPEIYNYADEFTTPEDVLLQELISTTRKRLRYADMLSGRVVGRLLNMLVNISNAQYLLEVGTFTGYAALQMAAALGEHGRLITLESNEKYATIASEFFSKSEHGHKIQMKIGRARDLLPDCTGPFDLIFLDADKDAYPVYFEILVPILKPGGLLVIDNAFWKGEILNPVTRKAKSVHTMNTMILNDVRVENVLLTVRDGVQLVRKKS